MWGYSTSGDMATQEQRDALWGSSPIIILGEDDKEMITIEETNHETSDTHDLCDEDASWRPQSNELNYDPVISNYSPAYATEAVGNEGNLLWNHSDEHNDLDMEEMENIGRMKERQEKER